MLGIIQDRRSLSYRRITMHMAHLRHFCSIISGKDLAMSVQLSVFDSCCSDLNHGNKNRHRDTGRLRQHMPKDRVHE